MDFSSFLLSDLRNAWVIATPNSTLQLYVRRTHPTHKSKLGDIQIANLQNSKPGKHDFTKFLTEWEPHLTFYIENVFNIRLCRFLERRGYTQSSPPPSTYPHLAAPCYLGAPHVKGIGKDKR